MEKDDITPELEGGEEPKELDLGGEGTPEEPETPVEPKEPTPPSDPLDDIQDEDARNEAKKHRAIARRTGKSPEEPAAPPTEPAGGYLSKQDFYKSNERKAVLQATRVEMSDSDETKAVKAYVTENWDGIRGLYASRKGKETTEDIFDDIQDAVLLFRSKNPPKEEDESAGELLTTPEVGTLIKDPASKKIKDPPRFKLPTKSEDWYKE